MRRTGIFAKLTLKDRDPPFFGGDVNGLVGDAFVDNPDGCIAGSPGVEGGPYGVGPERGREYSQGAGTPKGNLGNASGRGRTLKLRDDAF